MAVARRKSFVELLDLLVSRLLVSHEHEASVELRNFRN
jgi:hypothetical protein